MYIGTVGIACPDTHHVQASESFCRLQKIQLVSVQNKSQLNGFPMAVA